jgi:CRP-like cAMP-binding protein
VYQENVVNLQNKKVVVQHSYKTYFALMVKNLTKGLKPIDEMSDIWSALTHEERVYLRENTKYQEFKKNEMIYCEGEVPEFLYCVIVGKIKIFKNGVGSRQQILRFVKEGENFAFRAYFAGGNYVTSASALESVKVYSVPLIVIRQILESNNRLAMAFVKHLSADLGDIDSRIVSLTQKHIRGRLAETLAILIDTYGVDKESGYLKGSLSREDLAGFANMTASNAIRTLAAFDSEGLIALDGKKIRILNESQLRKVSLLG